MQRPTTIVYIATTLDGFIARVDGAIDWLEHDSKGNDYGWTAFRESIDGLILGRKTYEKVLSFGVEWPYVGLKTTVWSRTLQMADLPCELQGEGVRVSSLSPGELLHELGRDGLTRVWVDGGQTLQAFLALGVIDELTVTRIPVLIGAGIPLFGVIPRDVHLVHQHTEAFESGVVQSRYALKSAAD